MEGDFIKVIWFVTITKPNGNLTTVVCDTLNDAQVLKRLLPISSPANRNDKCKIYEGKEIE